MTELEKAVWESRLETSQNCLREEQRITAFLRMVCLADKLFLDLEESMKDPDLYEISESYEI